MTAYNLLPDGAGGWRAQYVPGVSSVPPLVDGVPDAPLSPEAEGQFTLSRELQRAVVAKALAGDRADAALNSGLDVMRGMQDIDAALSVDADMRPRSYAEQQQREQAASRLAAELGYVLAVLPNLSVTVQGLTGPYQRGVYGLIANAGNPLCEHIVYHGELPQIEARLRADDRERQRRASREAVEAEHAEKHPAYRVITEAQAYAESGAGRVAQIEAERAAERAELADIKAQLAALLAERQAV